jgi:hypothetical protein
MRRWRLAILILPALVLATFQAGTAAAAPPPPPAPPVYPPSIGSLSVSATVVTAGDTVRVWGDGYAPNTVVVFSGRVVLPITTSTQQRRRPADCRATGRLCVVRADWSGRISATIRLTRPGTTAIVASGTDPRGAARVLSAVVLVLSRSHRHELAAVDRLDAGAAKTPGGSGTSAVATRAAAGSPTVLPASLAAGAVLLAAAAAVAVRRRRHSGHSGQSAGQ